MEDIESFVLRENEDFIRETFQFNDEVLLLNTTKNKEGKFESSLFKIHVSPLGKVIVNGKLSFKSPKNENLKKCHEESKEKLRKEKLRNF